MNVAPEVIGLVLAGGSARRWGGRDKTAVELAARPVLCHALDALPVGMPAVVLAPPDHPARHHPSTAGRPLTWAREDPPGGGPVAALGAGLAAGPARGADLVVVLAGDLPFAAPAVTRLLAAVALEGAVAIDEQGRRQPLLAVYRTVPLRAALEALSGPLTGALTGQPLHAVLARLRLIEVGVSAREAFDLDNPDDLAVAAGWLGSPPGPDADRRV